ncbi:MAG: 4-hydroxy-3-methylbut-2-enyl diphosphate reductase [Planctomycetaceae bacterium]
MRIVRAQVMGFCFGVRDALATTDTIADPEQVAILGELVHNEQVLHQLERRGFRSVGEKQREVLPESPEVLITAHGISDFRRDRLLAAGKILHDTTCPLVRNVHRAAQRLAAEGRHVILIGKPDHVEVLGIVEDLNSYSVFVRPEDVIATGFPRLGILCQSTTSPTVADAVRRQIVAMHPAADLRFLDTICQPTKDRQQAVLDLLPEIDVLVVIGGARSNNCRALAELARRRGVKSLHVQSAADLQRESFGADDCVGVTAGTSTPDDVIETVIARLQAWSTTDDSFPLSASESMT